MRHLRDYRSLDFQFFAHVGTVFCFRQWLCKEHIHSNCSETEGGLKLNDRLLANMAGLPRDVLAHFACIIDLMLPIPFELLLEYLRRCSLVNFGKLIEGK